MNKVRYLMFLGVMLALTLSSNYAFHLGLEIQKEQSDFEILDKQINSRADLITDSDGVLYEEYGFDSVTVLLSRASSQMDYSEEQGLISSLLFDPETNANRADYTYRRICDLMSQVENINQGESAEINGSDDEKYGI